MTEPTQTEVLQSMLRVIDNTYVLLDSEGLFKGKHMGPIMEAKQLLANMREQTKAELDKVSLVLPSGSAISAIEASKV